MIVTPFILYVDLFSSLLTQPLFELRCTLLPCLSLSLSLSLSVSLSVSRPVFLCWYLLRVWDARGDVISWSGAWAADSPRGRLSLKWEGNLNLSLFKMWCLGWLDLDTSPRNRSCCFCLMLSHAQWVDLQPFMNCISVFNYFDLSLKYFWQHSFRSSILSYDDVGLALSF